MIFFRFYRFWLRTLYLFILIFTLIKNIRFRVYFENISYINGFDSLSSYFILLRCWICSLIFLARFKIYQLENYYKLFSLVVIFLLLMLLMVFSSLNLFIFYIYFEVSLIPLIILIIGWGYQPERLMAGIYLIFYTIFFSLPMIIGLFIIFKIRKRIIFFELNLIKRRILYFLINIVFFVKIPLYGIHLWLPKAHVEAPVSGSIILAGVTLKIGGYGLIRLIKVFLLCGLKINLFFIIFRLIGGLMVSIICLFQTDIKSLIAYSSISHMRIVMAGILTFNLVGFYGSLVLILAHGLCSSGLFCLANIYYERINSRRIYIMKGLINIFPNFGLFIFLLRVNNMAAPPSLNLLGEILLLRRLVAYNNILILIIIFLSFFGAVYSIYLFSFTNHGNFNSGIFSLFRGVYREYLILMLHWLPLNVLILISDSYLFI